jgi:hypothetical protein
MTDRSAGQISSEQSTLRNKQPCATPSRASSKQARPNADGEQNKPSFAT